MEIHSSFLCQKELLLYSYHYVFVIVHCSVLVSSLLPLSPPSHHEGTSTWFGNTLIQDKWSSFRQTPIVLLPPLLRAVAFVVVEV
mmetsp:Transcript_58529/g.143190  ORF Transcript_58529/g.143190 Transcript_58529/m.143190 type:complete len:85 (-) Transcript_58529:42-296(-)